MYDSIGVAEDILNKCTVNDPQYPNPDDENYTVAFNYEFIEDTSVEVNRYTLSDTCFVSQSSSVATHAVSRDL